MTERILIAGAGGQLAAAVAARYAGAGDVKGLSHAELDIASAADVERQVSLFEPTLIINCAAYNLVDRAEDEPAAALAANAFGPKNLARAATARGATFVHYSSDFVFDGRASEPYTEEDAPNPLSVYGTSKLLGEWFALESPGSFVLRVASLFGGPRAKSSVDRIVDALLDGRDAPVFSDRTASPSYVEDVAAATQALVRKGPPGLYHCVGTGHCTWYELGLEAARLLDADSTHLVPTLSDSVALRAQRPKYAVLDNRKLGKIVDLPGWKDALSRYISEVRRRRALRPSLQ